MSLVLKVNSEMLEYTKLNPIAVASLYVKFQNQTGAGYHDAKLYIGSPLPNLVIGVVESVKQAGKWTATKYFTHIWNETLLTVEWKGNEKICKEMMTRKNQLSLKKLNPRLNEIVEQYGLNKLQASPQISRAINL
jgi:hypothetical protein